MKTIKLKRAFFVVVDRRDGEIVRAESFNDMSEARMTEDAWGASSELITWDVWCHLCSMSRATAEDRLAIDDYLS